MTENHNKDDQRSQKASKGRIWISSSPTNIQTTTTVNEHHSTRVHTAAACLAIQARLLPPHGSTNMVSCKHELTQKSCKYGVKPEQFKLCHEPLVPRCAWCVKYLQYRVGAIVAEAFNLMYPTVRAPSLVAPADKRSR